MGGAPSAPPAYQTSILYPKIQKTQKYNKNTQIRKHNTQKYTNFFADFCCFYIKVQKINLNVKDVIKTNIKST